MRNHLKLPTLAFVAILLAAACGGSTASQAPTTSAAASAPAASSDASAAPSVAAVTPEPAADCAQSTADNAKQMWERSGGNKGMVDQVDGAWNTATPAKPNNL